MSARALGAALLLAVGVSAGMTTAAAAHPLGNFSVNRYARIEVGPERTTLRYVLDLAEIPTLQELQAAGIAADASEAAARRAILPVRVAAIAERAQLTIRDRRVAWTVADAALTMPDGQAGLRTMRVALTLRADLRARTGDALAFHDTNEAGRAGWHEVVLRGVDGTDLADRTAPSEDRSDELRRYPADPTIAPPDIDRASATIRIAGASLTPPTTSSAATSTARVGIDGGADVLASFLRRGTGGDIAALLAALGVAAALGALHALGPGHGKAIVGAYLVGSRGTPAHAVLLGATVTVTHTAGVYALGLLSLVAAQYVLPERVYPLLGAASGLVVVAVGASLARSRLRQMRGDAHPHDHGHDHDHGHPHDHAPRRMSLRSLIALGVSGGLLPCPTALVVLLAAISFHDVALGMALVAAFSVGLAAVLTSIGLAVVVSARVATRSRALARIASWRPVKLLPAASAVAIALAGILITVDALRALS